MKRRLVLALWGLLGAMAVQAGPVFRDNPELWSIDTAHFTFLFPRTAEASAQRVAALAEDVYTEVAGRLGVETSLHLPVVITPDTDDLNGYFTPYPSMRIVLYQAPLSPDHGFAAYRDTLRQLFLHELTHAVSLMSTDGFGTFLAALFGDSARPGAYSTPGVFVEGVTVSFESRDGYGRANDADYWQIVQQAALEDRWPTLIEASGAWDGYPRGLIYSFGGLFSRYLQETYGDQAYATLWRGLGAGKSLRDGWWTTGAFRKAFGVGVDEAWAQFRRWVALKVPVRVDPVPVDDGPTTISATASGNGTVWWADTRGLWARSEGQNRFVTEAGAGAQRLALSPDGSKILVSRFDNQGSLSTARVVELATATGAPTSRRFPDHLFEASYDGEGILACRAARYGFDLVRFGPSGDEVTLLSGRDGFSPSQPVRMDDGRIALVLNHGGQRSLAFLDGQGRLTVVEAEGVAGVRNLFGDGHQLWFAWDADLTSLKLGTWEAGRVTVFGPVSGGVRFPVPGPQGMYAVSALGRGERLALVPPQDGRPVATTEVEASAPVAPPVPDRPMHRYEPWLTALVPATRAPLLTLEPRATRTSDLVRGFGLATWGADPSGTEQIAAQALWLNRLQTWDATVTASASWGPVDWSLAGFDRWVPVSSRWFDVRQSGASLSLGTTWEALRDQASLQTTFGAHRAVQASGARFEVPAAATLEYRSLHPVGLEGDRWGYDLSGSVDSVTVQAAPRAVATGQLVGWFPWLGLTATAAATHTVTSGVSLGFEGPRPDDGSLWLGAGSVPSLPTGDRSITSSWMVSTSLTGGVSLPIRHDLPLVGYANALVFRTGYAAAWVDGGFGDSWSSRMVLNLRWDGVPAAVSVPLGVGLSLDVPVSHSGAPVWGLVAGSAMVN